jgi:anti-sigma28 factor (negative regulator of flagellin synthesis)
MKPVSESAAATPPTPAMSVPLSLTSKEWVIPPRPKPGRKPATDTPPTKRKAQNRAAQRAFRERRAARVGELEDQMKQVEEEHDQETDALKAKIEQLEKQIQQYKADIAQYADRCRGLENELASHKSRPITNVSNQDKPTGNDAAIGCGNCTLETRCQCIDEAFIAMGGDRTPTDDARQHDKRPHSPAHALSKRMKLEPKESLEVDFTSMFAARPPARVHPDEHSPTSAVADPCGFCSDGTPCICAEMAAEQDRAQTGTVSMLTRAAPRQLDQFTPPPSAGDVNMSSTIGAMAPQTCGGAAPGTCAQCRADPNSTLFCKSLAASRAQSGESPACCGGRTPGDSCCQSNDAVPLRISTRSTRSRTSTQPQTTMIDLPPPSGVRLTCADAYTTLSRHPAYQRAAGDIGEWMPKLHATDPTASGAIEGRPALEIDAANVMAVLRDFDRRFGKSS